jgi:hypothetical protein
MLAASWKRMRVQFIRETCAQQSIGRDQLTVYADRG